MNGSSEYRFPGCVRRFRKITSPLPSFHRGIFSSEREFSFVAREFSDRPHNFLADGTQLSVAGEKIFADPTQLSVAGDFLRSGKRCFITDSAEILPDGAEILPRAAKIVTADSQISSRGAVAGSNRRVCTSYVASR